MEISVKAKERFCKDCNIPIKLFKEPYFSERMELYDPFFGTIEKWNVFVKALEKYRCEQDYFEEYNKVKDAAIESIKGTEAYQRFNSDDMNKYRVKNENLSNKDIFKPSNEGKTFISIDMRKANFSSLQHYDKAIFGGADTWEEFICKFTDNQHIINSKYIRQVILGNCNPKRHITYEKYLMDGILTYLLENVSGEKKIVFFSNDEIVFDISHLYDDERYLTYLHYDYILSYIQPTCKVEIFTLHKVNGTNGYYKKIYKTDGEYDIEFKCLDNYMFPFVMRKVLGEKISDSDKVFYHEGLLARFLEVPEIEVNVDGF